MLCYDFYSKVLEIKHKLYFAAGSATPFPLKNCRCAPAGDSFNLPKIQYV